MWFFFSYILSCKTGLNLWLWAQSEVQAKRVWWMRVWDKEKTVASMSWDSIPTRVNSLCVVILLVHFQGPKHSLFFHLSLLASGAGSLSWHSDIWCLCRNTFLSCRKEFTRPLIMARDSTDKYILEMAWAAFFPLLLLFLYMPMHNLEKWNGLHC